MGDLDKEQKPDSAVASMVVAAQQMPVAWSDLAQGDESQGRIVDTKPWRNAEKGLVKAKLSIASATVWMKQRMEMKTKKGVTIARNALI